MRTTTETRLLLLAALERGPLNHFTIAEEIDEAPFYVHGWLKTLKRDRLVRELLDRHGHRWQLTDRGWGCLNEERQLTLDL